MGTKKSKKLNLPEFNINITALLDILTVLLFFLVKSFSVTSSTITPPKDIKIPTANAKEIAKESITVSISTKALRFNNDIIVKLSNGKFPQKTIGSDQRTILPLRKLLKKEDKKRRDLFKEYSHSEYLPSGKIIIQTDHKLPFGILKYVLHTSAVSGYKNFQFLVLNNEG